MGIEHFELLKEEVGLHMLSRARCPYSSVGYAGGVKIHRYFRHVIDYPYETFNLVVPSSLAALALDCRRHESADPFDPCNIYVVRCILDQVMLTSGQDIKECLHLHGLACCCFYCLITAVVISL